MNSNLKTNSDGNFSENTVLGYQSALKYFWGYALFKHDIKEPTYPVSIEIIESFVEDHLKGLPPDLDAKLVEFGFKAGPGKLRVGTIDHRLNAISYAHRMNNLKPFRKSEKIKDLLYLARRSELKSGLRPRKAKPITGPLLEKMISNIDPRTLKGKRARAILKFGFYTGGRRRSEIADARYVFLDEHKGGFFYLLHRSKTDQTGAGQTLFLRRKHAQALKSWIKAANITDGYLFRQIDRSGNVTSKAINVAFISSIIKEFVETCGKDPANYSAHSLRHGFVSYAAGKGINIFNIMAVTGHKDLRTIYGYYSPGEVQRNPAVLL